MMKAGLLLVILNFYFVRAIPSTIDVKVMNYWDKHSNKGFNFIHYFESLEHKFQQKLDHFDEKNHETWHQRYWVNSSWYKPGGPAFLLVNGEGTASADWSIDFGGYWLSYAKELNAFCFSLEHRFYGKSWPAKPNDNLKYLSSRQAVEDIGNFIHGATEEFKLPKDIKWIVFGVSYGGSLAAWARLMFPHLVFGAVASSAPLLAKVDYSEYLQVVEQSLNSYHPKCVKSIASASRVLVRLNRTEAGRRNITKTFNLQNGENKTTNVLEDVFSQVKDILSNAVQHSYMIRIDIPFVCNLMVDKNRTKYESLAILKKENDDTRDYSRLSGADLKSWLYQMCTEFGFFDTVGEKLALFAGNYSYSIEKAIQDNCKEFFGSEVSVQDMYKRVRRTNRVYGGLDYNVNNTLFVHGSLDPLHVLGLHTVKNDSLYQTIFINGSSHAADMSYPLNTKIQRVANARLVTLVILKAWLKKELTKEYCTDYLRKLKEKRKPRFIRRMPIWQGKSSILLSYRFMPPVIPVRIWEAEEYACAMKLFLPVVLE